MLQEQEFVLLPCLSSAGCITLIRLPPFRIGSLNKGKAKGDESSK
jgi:hypothetical protein